MLGKYAWTKVSVCRYSMEKRHPQNSDALVLTGNGKEKPWDHQQHLKVSVNTAPLSTFPRRSATLPPHHHKLCFSQSSVLFYYHVITMTLSLGLYSPNSFAHTITEIFKGTLSLFPTQDLLKQTVEQNRKFQKTNDLSLGNWVSG